MSPRRICSTLAVHLALIGAGLATGAHAQRPPDELPTIESKTEGMQELAGYIDLYWSEREGKLYLELDRWGEELLHQISLTTGLGSNPVGLDRGQLGSTAILAAQRVGPRVLLMEPNYRYRARSQDVAEVRAVAEAFAPSVHWGFEVVAQTGDRALVDATDFFLRDAHGIARTLERARQGTFRLERSRSVFHLPRTKAFPENTEIEVVLTFTSGQPGGLVSSTAASGEAVTFRVHHSLVRLPGDGYEPRRADPRVGAFGMSFMDYAAPIDQDPAVRWVARHRLEKRDPTAERSEPVEPIVYYLDPGVPEPVRSALLDGARWWNQAFEAAGFVDAFRVEVLPDGADPMDLRYNMIHWTHRSTRGWSYGSTVADPRTGEILKGNVNLGSLRLRQDHLIARGLVPPAGAQFGVCDLSAGPAFDYLAIVADGDPVEMALARVRQLSAHEVGHTLGLAHNYIASTYGRASVMDYPAPLVRLTGDGRLDLSDAYAVGAGEYDKFAIRWLYADFPPGASEPEALEAIVQDGLSRGIRFLTDQDARPAGGAHPLAGLWDNGSDPVAMLGHEMEVRRIGLDAFGEGSVPEGEPLASLEKVLVPLYLHHRYQVEAAAKSIGGMDYAFALRGDGQTPLRRVPADRQRAAVDAVLATLDAAALALPERVLQLIPPRAFRVPSGETFDGHTSPTLDPFAAAASAADLTLGFVLQPERMARLVEQHSRDASLPGLDEVVDRLMEVTWRAAAPGDAYVAEVQRTVQRVVVDGMMQHAGSTSNSPAVRAVLNAELLQLAEWLAGRTSPTPHQMLALEDIKRWRARPWGENEATPAPAAPPGSPIGGGRRR
jgi:hypothetical protein